MPQAGAFGRTDGPGEPLAGDAAGTDENAISGELMAGGSGDLALAGAPARHARPAPAVIAPIRTIAQTGLLPAIPDTFESPSSPSFHEATQAIRTLPPVLDADSWDTEPAEPANQDYNGRRRAAAWPLRIWSSSAWS